MKLLYTIMNMNTIKYVYIWTRLRKKLSDYAKILWLFLDIR